MSPERENPGSTLYDVAIGVREAAKENQRIALRFVNLARVGAVISAVVAFLGFVLLFVLAAVMVARTS